MKRILAIIMALCLLAGVLCFAACSADQSEKDDYDRVSDEAFEESALDEIEGKLPDDWKTTGGWEYYSASLFGEGSPAMIVALLAFIMSIASICLTGALYKKIGGFATPKDDSKDEES